MDRTEALQVFEEADCRPTGKRSGSHRPDGRRDHGTDQQLNPVIFCVMNGGHIVTGQLLPLLPFSLETGYCATRYGRELTGGDLEWLVPPVSTSLADRAAG